jgi:Mg2+-importing ATPase
MDFSRYTAASVPIVLTELDSNLEGLSPEEAVNRLQKYGSNKISKIKTTLLELLLRQLKSPFLFLLLGAALLSFLLGQHINALMIIGFVIINTILGFYQEFRSEQILKLLKKYITPLAKVKRAGEEIEVPSEELVPGDILILEPGQILAADARIISSADLSLDESILSGESLPVKKNEKKLSHSTKQIYKAKNIVFSGTNVVSGRGLAIVFATAKETAIGRVTKLTAEITRESFFEKELAKLSQFILRLVLLTLALIFLVNLVIKGTTVNQIDFLVFTIALAVSVVPEALPVVTTFSFSRGALRLAKHRVVVRRLSAVEGLGAIEVLCTDKTGTLTENKMKIDEIFSENKNQAVFSALLGSTAVKTQKSPVNPFDQALWEALGQKEKGLLKQYSKIKEIPFDSLRRRDTSILSLKGKYFLISRGAPETILSLCSPLPRQLRKSIQKWLKEKGKQGKRILAVARKRSDTDDKTLNQERGLEFLGLISFIDPIKATAKEAVLKAEKLGISIKLLTGDAKEIAGVVACEIGLIDSPEKVILGEEFDKLSVPVQKQAVDKYLVFARVTPIQKYRIIQLLQEKYEVGYVGEGINDAPALKIANVALAVQGASEIAKDVSDIVLLKKDLKVIVDGVKEGREIFVNTTKYITATLSANFGNFYAVAIASLLIPFLPMLPAQILLVNLLSDFPMIAMAADNVDNEELKKPRKYDVKSIAYLSSILGSVSSVFDFIFFILFYKISATVLQTGWFMESILSELVFILSIRTRRFFLKTKPPSFILIALIVIASLTTLVLPFTSLGRLLFNFQALSAAQLGLIGLIVIGYFIATEITKLSYKKFADNSRLHQSQ